MGELSENMKRKRDKCKKEICYFSQDQQNFIYEQTWIFLDEYR